MKKKSQHAKLQAARAALKLELQYTNDEKIKYKSRVASHYIDAEPDTRAGRQAFENLNEAKDNYREVLKTEEVLQTLLTLTKKANQVESAEDRKAAIEVASAKARSDRARERAIKRDEDMFAILTHEREAREQAEARRIERDIAMHKAAAYKRSRDAALKIAKDNAAFDIDVAARALKAANARSRATKRTDIVQIWDVLAGDIFTNDAIVAKFAKDRMRIAQNKANTAFFVDPYTQVTATSAITVNQAKAMLMGIDIYNRFPINMPAFRLRSKTDRRVETRYSKRDRRAVVPQKIVFKFQGE